MKMCSQLVSNKVLNEMKCGFNSLKSLCKSLDKIKCIFTQNNSVLCEAIECQMNCYLDMNFTIDLNLCKISHTAKILYKWRYVVTKWCLVITKWYLVIT